MHTHVIGTKVMSWKKAKTKICICKTLFFFNYFHCKNCFLGKIFSTYQSFWYDKYQTCNFKFVIFSKFYLAALLWGHHKQSPFQISFYLFALSLFFKLSQYAQVTKLNRFFKYYTTHQFSKWHIGHYIYGVASIPWF